MRAVPLWTKSGRFRSGRDTARAMSEGNAEAFIRRAYAELNQAFREPSGQALRDYLDEYWSPGAVYVNPPDVPDPGAHTGIDAVWTQFRRWIEPIPDLQLEPLEIIRGSDDQAFVWVRFSGHGAGSVAPIDVGVAQVVTVVDGKILRCESFTKRDTALQAAGLSK